MEVECPWPMHLPFTPFFCVSKVRVRKYAKYKSNEGCVGTRFCHLSRIGCSTTWRPCYEKSLCVYQGYIKRKDLSWSCQLCMYPFLYWMHSKLTLLAQWAWLVVALHRWMIGLLFCRTEIGVSVQIWACHLVVGVSHGGWAPVGWLSDQLHIGWFLHFQVCTVYHLGWFFLCVLHGKRLQGSWQCVHRSGILYWVNYPLGAFCQPDEPPCLCFVAGVGMTLMVVTSLARWREMQNSSLATGCTVSRVDSVGIANYNVWAVVCLWGAITGYSHLP